MRSDTIHTRKTNKLWRYEKVIATLVKYGFEDILSHPPFSSILPQTSMVVPSRNGRKVSQYSRYERIRMVCEELGTTFIKFAQVASNRPDLIPEDLIFELEKLQDQAPRVPLEQINRVIETELVRPLDQMVESFESEPLACASMAQVHRAVLNGGKQVVLKIQRPGIRETVRADIDILHSLVNVIESYFPQYEHYNPSELLKMFEQSIQEELSFRLEAQNLIHFQNMFRDNHDVFIPSIYRELSTDKIICMEYVDGHKITDLENLAQHNVTGEELAKRGISLYFEQVFEHGFFHADPHPGNIFVLEDGRIAFIDFGMVGSVMERDKVLFAKILLSMYTQDVQGLKKAILKFSTGLSKEKERDFEYDVIYFLRQYSSVSLEDIDGNEVMRGLNSLFFDYSIRIPSNLLLLIKALIIIEGVGLKLDPQYDIIQNIGPYVQRLLTRTFNPSKISKDVIKTFEDTTYLLQELPDDIREILRKVKEGKLHIEFEHKGLMPFGKELSGSIYHLSYAMIIVAALIASALLIIANVPPYYDDVPVSGIIGIGLSLVGILRLLYLVRKTKKEK